MKKITKKEYDRLWLLYEGKGEELGKSRRLASARDFGSAGYFYGAIDYSYEAYDSTWGQVRSRIEHFSPAGCKNPKFRKTTVVCLMKVRYGRGFQYFVDEHLPYMGECKSILTKLEKGEKWRYGG